MNKHKLFIDYFNRNFLCDNNPRMTDCHVFMISVCVDILLNSRAFKNHVQDIDKSISVVAVPNLKIDNTLPDIYTPFFDVECETGFKHDLKTLKKRILKSSKTVIVVLPNVEVENRYLRELIDLKKQKLKICSMAEFSNTVYDVLRSIDRKKE